MPVTNVRARWSFSQSPSAPLERLSDAQVAALTESDEGFDAICDGLPAEVHVELLRLGRIPDPFLRDNEDAVQWVGETGWVYKGVFDQMPDLSLTTELVIDRLDTFAHVWLDGRHLHENANGLHCDQRLDVTEQIWSGARHVLLIQFLPPVLMARQLEQRSSFDAVVWNGEPARAFARKSQYHWSWDWGPRLVSVGIQGDVYVQSYDSRISKMQVHWRPGGNALSSGTLEVAAEYAGEGVEQVVRLTEPGGRRSVHAMTTKAANGGIFTRIPIHEPQLWWPAHLGDQPLYTVELLLVDDYGRVQDRCTKRIGLRTIRVVQEPLVGQPGTTFLLEVNSVPIFAGGSNWIPLDSFLVRTTKERLRTWLTLARDGNQNMIRVWGGGSHETDDFYDLCDELGLLVWQDFPFACGLYPADDVFCRNVEGEVRVNLERIRHHPSLAVLAGNNEDYQVAESLGYYRSTTDFDPARFPAKHIYEKLLPELVAELAPDTFYTPGSPWTGGNTRDPRRGDNHAWNIWHGKEAPYQEWEKESARFISEYGMQAYPDIRTIDYWLDGRQAQRSPTSKLVQHHQKAAEGARRLNKYLAHNLTVPDNLEDYVYMSQLMQAECILAAVQTWRRGFKGPGRYECAGSLVWQLNDCWPSISWSLVDYFARPKAAYFTMKRALAPIAIGAKRYINGDETRLDIWISHTARQQSDRLILFVDFYEIASGVRLQHACIRKRCRLEPMSCLEPNSFVMPSKSAARWVVATTVKEETSGKIICRHANWPEPLQNVRFSLDTVVKVQVDTNACMLCISANRPVKGLILSLGTDGARLTDNALDLMPDDPQSISYTGNLTSDQLHWRYLTTESNGSLGIVQDR